MDARRPGTIVRAGGRSAGSFVAGIDVGGTKIAGGIVDLETGSIGTPLRVPTRPERGGEAVLKDVIAMASELQAAASRSGTPLWGIGLGVAELVNPNGDVFSDYRIAWKGLGVRQRLSAILPALVESDVRAAALGEARYGSGQGIADFLYLNIGTGVSAVSVRHGRPYAGAHGAALVIANGPRHRACARCGHDETTVLEDIASGSAIAAAFGVGSAEEVLAAAGAGVARAAAVIDHAADALGETIALLVGALDPAAVVIGGGLGSAQGRYADRLDAAIRAGLWSGADWPLPILRSSIGPRAGVIGAAAAFADSHARQAEPELQLTD